MTRLGSIFTPNSNKRYAKREALLASHFTGKKIEATGHSVSCLKSLG